MARYKFMVVRDGKLEREFYSLKRSYGKKSITVWGEFYAE